MSFGAQCPPNGTLTDIAKQVQTQLASFYVTLIHKSSFYRGDLGVIGSIGGWKVIFSTVEYQQKCVISNKMPLNKKNKKKTEIN